MEILIGTANPDHIEIKNEENEDWLINISHEDSSVIPIPFIFGMDNEGNKKCWVGEPSELHHQLIMRNDKDISVTYITGRLWEKYKFITFWGLNKEFVKKNIPLCLESLENEHNIDLSDYSFLYNTTSKYVKKINVYEYLGKQHSIEDAKDTTKEREWHLMSPMQKQQQLQNNNDLKRQRQEYFKSGDRAWVNKFGNIDPALYHLLAYQENKKRTNVIISESDIKTMVKECIKKILNENVSSIVYHYTHPSSLLSIIKTNRFVMSDDGGMSVTRQKNDQIGYATAFRQEYFDGAYVRLQLDGDKLNARFKGKPVDEFGARGEVTMDSFHKNTWNARRPFYTQAEDKIFSTNGEYIENAIYYIDRIDIQFLIEDERYDSIIGDINNFIDELVTLTDGTPWENKIFIYFDEKGNRKDFNFQTNNCYKISDIKNFEKNNINEGKNYDILYRGIGKNQNENVPVLWLTTSKQYCKNYGNNVLKYAVKMNILDSLANEKETLNYLIVDTDEYPFYEAQNFDIEKMKKDGFCGYYYHEDEYNCLNVCLFNKNNAKLLEN